MSKIMLVEDDTSLLEIYQARLIAEGYDVVTAGDGEEALTVALKEHPDLIIADVMMPKVSGFDMVDILRSTPATKATKIIMMTALNQAEDKARAEKLGADKYLVKSQVTLEDVTKIVHDVLAEQEAAANTAVSENTGVQPSTIINSANSTPTKTPLSSTAQQPNPANPPIPTPPPTVKITDSAIPTPPPTSPQSPKTLSTTPPIPPQKSSAPPISTIPVTTAPTQVPTPQPTTTVTTKMAPKPVLDSSKPSTNSVSIKVTSDDNKSSDTDSDESGNDAEKDLSQPKDQYGPVKDPFLAKNPTLSDSPEPTIPLDQIEPTTISSSNDNTNGPKDNSIAEEAVKSLASPTNEIEDKDIDSNQAMPNKTPDSTNQTNNPKYLQTDKDNETKSMSHSKIIEPTPNLEDNATHTMPDLTELAKTDIGDTPPPVNSVITPDANVDNKEEI